MIPLVWTKTAVVAIAFAALSGATYLGYSKIKSIGYAEAEVKYELVIKEYNDNIAEKISSIETLSTVLATQQQENTVALSKSIEGVLYAMKGKTLTIIKDGKCVPSQTFSDSISTLNSTVNQNMKDSRK